MKDKIHIKRANQKGFKLTRTLTEYVSPEDIQERIKKVEGDIEAYTDAQENLIKNKDEILKKNSEKIDKDIEAYGKAIENLKGNLRALKDAVVLGEGKSESEQKGDSYVGVVE